MRKFLVLTFDIDICPAFLKSKFLSLVPSLKLSVSNKTLYISGDTIQILGNIAISDFAKGQVTVSFFVYSSTTIAMIAELRNNSFSATSDGKRLFQDRLSVNQENQAFIVSISNLAVNDYDI